MSTKTSIKRIALVAVSALGFGLVSVAPSNAAVQSDSLTLASTTSTTTVGVASTNVITLSFLDDNAGADTMTATLALLSSPTTSTALPSVSETVAQDAANPAGATTTSTVFSLASAGAGRVTASATVSLTPDVAGTYVVRITPGGGFTTTAQTWTITTGAALAVTAADSTSFLNAGETVAATADATVVASKDLSNAAQRATIVVTPLTAGALAPLAPVALTATISGPGQLGFGTVANVATIVPGGRSFSGAAGEYAIGVFSDGTAGVATITVSQGSTVLATETVTFFGAAASITPTVVNSAIPVGAGGAAVGAITGIVRDAAGVVVAGATVRVVSSATTVISNSYSTCQAASDATGKVTCDLTGVAAGTANITLTTNASATDTTGVSASPVAIRVGSGTPALVKLSFNKETYLPGEGATLTITLLDSTGLPVVNGTYNNIFAGALTSSLALASGTLPAPIGPATTVPVTTSGSTGSSTVTVNMPLVAGTVTITGTGSTGLPTAAQVATTASATVTGGEAIDAANAATDAAAEAIDAANAATDAANLAAEAADAATVAAEEARDAADAATAAVEELATQVATLMAALKAQITTLANTVAKIAKKVKA